MPAPGWQRHPSELGVADLDAAHNEAGVGKLPGLPSQRLAEGTVAQVAEVDGRHRARVRGCARKKFHMMVFAETEKVVRPITAARFAETLLPGQLWPPPFTL